MRIGIFGGTFDPPHIGHLVLAMESLNQLKLAKLLWVVTASPPHKQDQKITPVEIRVELVAAAIQDDPGFVLSRIEVDRAGPHYAADTVGMLAQQYPEDDLCYLIGGDSLRDFPNWYKPEIILKNINCLGVMRRPEGCFDLEFLDDRLPGIRDKIHFIETPMLEISSSEIREKILKGEPYKYYLPAPVNRLIEEKGYYRSDHSR